MFNIWESTWCVHPLVSVANKSKSFWFPEMSAVCEVIIFDRCKGTFGKQALKIHLIQILKALKSNTWIYKQIPPTRELVRCHLFRKTTPLFPHPHHPQPKKSPHGLQKPGNKLPRNALFQQHRAHHPNQGVHHRFPSRTHPLRWGTRRTSPFCSQKKISKRGWVSRSRLPQAEGGMAVVCFFRGKTLLGHPRVVLSGKKSLRFFACPLASKKKHVYWLAGRPLFLESRWLCLFLFPEGSFRFHNYLKW